MQDHPRNFVYPTTVVAISMMAVVHKKAELYFGEEEPREGNVHKDAFVHRFAKDSTNESIPVQAVSCKSFVITYPQYGARKNLPSVAYACGFGYNSLLTFASQSPRSVSKTSLHNDVKNSLNTPPPSIPALQFHRQILLHNRKITTYSSAPN